MKTVILRNLKAGGLILLIAILLLAILKWFLIPLASSAEFQDLVFRLGLWGYLLVILYTVVSHVFAPLSGAPAMAFSFSLYGLATGLVLLYLASLLGAAANFWISRLWGRRLVRKFAGQQSLKEVDEFAKVSGKKALWVSRLLGFAVFEVVSYAAGLTTIKFHDYLLITALGNLPIYLVTYLIFASTAVSDEFFILAWVVSVFLAGAVFLGLVHSYNKRRNGRLRKILRRFSILTKL